MEKKIVLLRQVHPKPLGWTGCLSTAYQVEKSESSIHAEVTRGRATHKERGCESARLICVTLWQRDSVTEWHVWHVTLDVKWSIIVKELSQKLPLDDSYEGFSFTRSRPLDLDWSDEDRRSRMTMDPTDEMKTHDEIRNIWMMRSWRDMIGHIRSKM